MLASCYPSGTGTLSHEGARNFFEGLTDQLKIIRLKVSK
jgi:hypothetical protein